MKSRPISFWLLAYPSGKEETKIANPVFELFAKIGLDDKEYKSKLGSAGSTLKSFGSGAVKTIGVTAKAIGAGVADGAAAVAKLTKNAVESYAEYEQLSGGVAKLFGSDADAVMDHASEAFRTAGMNVNQYMETVTGFSAALISGLDGDTQQAAEVADMAVRDMADNANTFGTSIESIQNAYQGFAKGNFTMLDNLKLGYGGTAEEMARLVNDSGLLDGMFTATADNVKDIPFDIMVRAINAVQKEMGITGTTAKEAMYTISGSVGAAKSAWANLVTGIADENADLDGLIDDFLTTIIGENGKGGVINNILPVAEKVLGGISTLISTVVPTLLPLAVNLITANLPTITNAGAEVLAALLTGLAMALPGLIEAIPGIVTTFVGALKTAWPDIKAAGAELLQVVGDGLKGAWDAAKTWGSDMIQLFIDGIKAKAAALWEEVKGIAGGIADFLHFSVPEKGPLADLDDSPRDMMQMYAAGIRKNQHLVTDELSRSFDFTPQVGDALVTGGSGRVINFSPTITISGDIPDAREKAQELMYEMKNILDREAAAYA